MGLHSASRSSGWRRSWRQTMTTFRHLLDEEVEVEGDEEEASSLSEEEKVEEVMEKVMGRPLLEWIGGPPILKPPPLIN
ncbi:UNVERIFIED_CONTAM: hypothetical protein Sradi_2634100 [Sesamum radiatum]|uniref:Uncharacterized protein n=1 Tax=Sesamum radiatum TaxID=300843 RepID=A0AAW2S4W7_SESRA